MCALLFLTWSCQAFAEQPNQWWKVWQYFSSPSDIEILIPRIDEAHQVKDLPYGELLFDYYQQHYMTSITKILVERERGGFKHHKPHADLLLGSLYLSYGLVNQAEIIFKILIEKSVDQETQNNAWLKLAEIYIEQGKLDNAKEILKLKIKEPVERILNQKNEYLGDISLQQQSYANALDYFDAIKNDLIKQRYASYNSAIAHLRLNQPHLALLRFQDLIAQPVNTKEEDAIRDKAAIALGHYHLHHEEPYLASTAFKKVRLHGPFADQALLGLGWANLIRTQTKQALAPWVALSKLDLSSPTTQQALLMVPRTFENLQAWSNAYESYQLARDSFQNEIIHIESTLTYIRHNHWITQLRPNAGVVQQHHTPLDYQSTEIPLQGPEASHLFRLFASQEFDQGFQQYWFLESLNLHISEWQKQMPVFRDMLSNHQLRHNQMMPEVQRQLDQVALGSKQDQLARYEQRFHQITDNNNLTSLATDQERELLQRIRSAETTLAQLPDNEKFSESGAKLRLAKGALLWDINEQASDREWKLLKQLKQTTVALYQLEQKQRHLLNAEHFAADRFNGYEQRINEIEKRNTEIGLKIRLVQERQQHYLQTLAETLLEERLTHVGNLLANTQLAIARLQDKASVEGNSAQ